LKKDTVIFYASWDIRTWVITFSVILLTSWIELTRLPQTALFLSQSNESVTIAVIAPILILIILFFTILFAPIRYSISPGEIIVHRLGPNIVIPIKNIISVMRVDEEDFYFSTLRMFGSGGFFGYYGWFWNNKLGMYKAYGTNKYNAVLIKIAGNKKILVSPDRPDEFMQLITDHSK
jgi:hypothetical protein